ncbi:hypothetical protein HK405_001626, partial [Cladochytrium tenue]
WVTDWTIDMRGDVDPDGWSYSVHFRYPEWSGAPDMTHYVRRRRWIRTRRRAATAASVPAQLPAASVTTTTSSAASSPTAAAATDDAYQFLVRLPTMLHRLPLDRRRLEFLRSHVSKIQVASIVQEFDYDAYRLEALTVLAPLLSLEALPACERMLRFHEHREALTSFA